MFYTNNNDYNNLKRVGVLMKFCELFEKIKLNQIILIFIREKKKTNKQKCQNNNMSSKNGGKYIKANKTLQKPN